MVRLYESAWKDYDRGQYDAHMQQRGGGRTDGADIWKAIFDMKTLPLFMQGAEVISFHGRSSIFLRRIFKDDGGYREEACIC